MTFWLLTVIKKQGSKWLLDLQPGGRNGPRIRKLFDTKSQAARYEIQIKQKYFVDPASIDQRSDKRRLNDFVMLWFDNTGKHLTSGVDTKDRMLKASSMMGNPVMALFKPVVFLEYRSSRIDAGISPATLNRELQTFKSVFNDLRRSSLYHSVNPFDNIKKIRVHQSKMVFLTLEQIDQLFKLLRRSDFDVYLVALVCLSTGARWGEAQALTITDLSNNQVHFHQTKSKKSRSVPVDPSLFAALQARLSAGPFVNSYSTFTRRLQESGIDLPKGQRTHILRHTFASHYVMNGGNILSLQRILGHSSLDMTMRYSHLSPDYLNEVLEKNPASSLCRHLPHSQDDGQKKTS